MIFCFFGNADDEDPVLTCPSNMINIGTDQGVSTAVVTWSPTPSATDNVDTISASSISCVDGDSSAVSSGQAFDLGTTVVTCTVSDTAGNRDNCTFNIGIVGKYCLSSFDE